MGRQHVGEPADFPSTHGVRLAGQRERSHAGAADAARRQMAVEDGIDLVATDGGLVDALAVTGDDLLRAGKKIEECRELGLAKPGRLQEIRRGQSPRGIERLRKAEGVAGDVVAVDRTGFHQMGEQAVKQREVTIRLQRQMHVCDVAGRRAARIDDHDLHLRPGLPRRHDALVDDRVAPGQIRAREDDQVRQFQVFIGAGNSI